jgi:aconitate hydratase
LVNFGILQLTFADDADYDRIDDGDELAIDDVHQAIEQEVVVVRNTTKGLQVKTKCILTSRQRAIILSGGALNYAALGAQ